MSISFPAFPTLSLRRSINDVYSLHFFAIAVFSAPTGLKWPQPSCRFYIWYRVPNVNIPYLFRKCQNLLEFRLFLKPKFHIWWQFYCKISKFFICLLEDCLSLGHCRVQKSLEEIEIVGLCKYIHKLAGNVM